MINEPCKLSPDRYLMAASALVETALLNFEGNSNVTLHPQLKRRISQEIAKNPELTKDLFEPNFFKEFLNGIIEELY